MAEQEKSVLVEEKQINEEYKARTPPPSCPSNLSCRLGRKTRPFSTIVTHALEWPSLTAEWFPDCETVDNFTKQRLLIGTHTSDSQANYLQIIELTLPKEDSLSDGATIPHHLQITHKIPHDGEVNRARYMPSNPDILASRTVFGHINIFDRKRHPSFPSSPSQPCTPELVLSGLTGEGYGLEWHPSKPGILASASEMGVVAVWDLNKGMANVGPVGSLAKRVEPVWSCEGHSMAWVEDVAWNSLHDCILGSVGDDKMLLIWDTRSPKTPKHSTLAHSREINCIQFHPEVEYIIATGSADKCVNLWDLRNLKSRVHSLENHTDEILQVQWQSSPVKSSSSSGGAAGTTVLASSGADRRLMVWDLSKVGEEQSPEDAEDGPPELLFVHGGHTNKISDFAWNKNFPWMICSVAEDNICQIWQMASHIYATGGDVDEDELE